MRGMLMGLVMVMAVGAVRGEVVGVDGSASSSPSSFSGFAGTTKVEFNGASGYRINSIKLFGSSNSTTTNQTLNILLYDSNGTTVLRSTGATLYQNDTLFAGGGLQQGSIDVSSTLGLENLDSRNYFIGFDLSAGSDKLNLQLRGTGTPVNGALNYVAPGLYTLPGYTFGIYVVPEPGTLLLGSIAAACGGGGVWWRRKRKAAPVADETVAAE